MLTGASVWKATFGGDFMRYHTRSRGDNEPIVVNGVEFISRLRAWLVRKPDMCFGGFHFSG